MLRVGVAVAIGAMLISCSSGDDGDDGPPVEKDAGFRDAGVEEPRDGGSQPGRDGGFADAGPGRDGGEVRDGGPARDGGTGPARCGVAQIAGFAFDSMANAIVFAPTDPGEVTVDPIEPSADIRRVVVARMEDTGFSWAAQVVSQAATNNLAVHRVVHDPGDGATYVAFGKRRPGTAVRFYDADGTLFREHSVGGAAGSELSTDDGTNLFVARFDDTGAIVWLKRFGPNAAMGVDQATVVGLGLTAGTVRVIATTSEPGPVSRDPDVVVLGPGEADELTFDPPSNVVFVADFDRADGEYVDGTARFVQSPPEGLFAPGGETNAGRTLLTGYMRSATSVDFGGGETTTPSTTSAAVVALLAPNGDLSWARRIERTDVDIPPRPTATALLPDGSSIVTGWASSASRPLVDYEMETTTGTVTIGQLEGRDAFVMRITPAGDLAWFRRVASRSEGPPDALAADESNDALFLVGPAENQVFDPGLPSETPVRSGNGRFLARLSLSTGEVQWVETQVATEGFATTRAPSIRADGVYLPAQFSAVDFGAGAVRKASDTNGWAVVRYSLDGDFVACGDVADNPRRVQFE